jgi:hypothetical protein
VQRTVVVVLVLAAAVAAWFVFGGTDPEPEDVTPTTGPETPAETPGEDEGAGLAGAQPAGPPVEPYAPILSRGGRALMIAHIRSTWTATVELSLQRIRELQYRIWYTAGQTGEPMTVPGRGLSELLAKPTAEYLRDHDIQLLVVDQIDPNGFPELFWNVVAERVRDGRMGLYFRPDIPLDGAGQMLSVHPALTHPTLKTLLPVEEASVLEGTPVPGTFKQQAPFRITTAGAEHPATRMVDDPLQSRALWDRAGTGEGAIGTFFCYPVMQVREGAQVLVNVDAGAATIPAVVASAPPLRVIWMGNANFGDRFTHYAHEKNIFQTTMLNRWWLFLMGQEPPAHTGK